MVYALEVNFLTIGITEKMEEFLTQGKECKTKGIGTWCSHTNRTVKY